MKNMPVSRVMTFAAIAVLAMLSLAAPSSAQQTAAPTAPVAQQAPAMSQPPAQPAAAVAPSDAAATPALAAQYFEALDTSTKQCHVMAQRPDGTAMKQVGSGAYKSEAEAQKAIQSLTECNS